MNELKTKLTEKLVFIFESAIGRFIEARGVNATKKPDAKIGTQTIGIGRKPEGILICGESAI